MNCSSQPTMVERIAQVCEKGHFKIAVQVQHLRPLPDRLLPHLFVQGWTGLPGAPLSPSTPSDQEGYCLYVIDLQMYIFRQVGPTTCPGPVQFYIVLTQYLVACWSWQTCLLFLIINMNSLTSPMFLTKSTKSTLLKTSPLRPPGLR